MKQPIRTNRTHLVILLTLFLCLMGTVGETWAYTIKLRTQAGGRFRYRIETGVGTGIYTPTGASATSSSWSSYSTSTSYVTLNVASGRRFQMQATSNPDATGTYYFVKWANSGTGSSTIYNYSTTVKPTADWSFTANFTTTGYTLKAKPNQIAYGNVSISGPVATVTGTDGETISATIGSGAHVTVKATAASGHGFVKWGGGPDSSTSASYTFTMDQARTLTAYFWSDTWAGTLDQVSNNTYTITSESSDIFKVACSGSTYHNQFYKYIGNVTAQSGTVTLAFNNTSTVLMKGTVKAGGTSKVNVTVNGNRTLKRAATYNYMFNVDTDATMNINTANSYTLTLDGGSTFATSGDGRTKWNTSSFSGTMMHVQGTLTMKKTVLQNSFFSGHAPSIRFNSGRENHKNATLQNVEIKGMQGPSVLIITGNDFHNITWTNVKVYHCMQVGSAQEPSITTNDAGGIIRTNGNTMSSLTLSGCEI